MPFLYNLLSKVTKVRLFFHSLQDSLSLSQTITTLPFFLKDRCQK